MIKLSVEDCKKINPRKINYYIGENDIREKNIQMLKDLISLMKNNSIISFLENENENENIDNIPNEIINYYNNYIDNNNKDNNKILNAVKKEYKDLVFKIKKFSEKWNVEINEVKNNLFCNDLFLLTFVKDPGKQTFHQHFAAEWIKKIEFIDNFQELSSGGQNALYVVNGEIVSGKQKHNQKTGKSIDFVWEYIFNDKKMLFYSTNKYTKTSGGSQDNQYKDVQEFHTEAKQSIDENIYFLSITDGPYYLLKETSLKDLNKTKLDYLNTGRFKGDRNLATNCDLLVSDIVPIIIKWLENNFSNEEIEEEIKKLNIIKDKYNFDK